jgi:hypothetical protein
MANRPAGFFQEPSGDRSMGRLLSFLMFLACLYFGYDATKKPVDQAGASITIFQSLLLGGATIKTIPKVAEQFRPVGDDPGR